MTRIEEGHSPVEPVPGPPALGTSRGLLNLPVSPADQRPRSPDRLLSTEAKILALAFWFRVDGLLLLGTGGGIILVALLSATGLKRYPSPVEEPPELVLAAIAFLLGIASYSMGNSLARFCLTLKTLGVLFLGIALAVWVPFFVPYRHPPGPWDVTPGFVLGLSLMSLLLVLLGSLRPLSSREAALRACNEITSSTKHSFPQWKDIWYSSTPHGICEPGVGRPPVPRPTL